MKKGQDACTLHVSGTLVQHSPERLQSAPRANGVAVTVARNSSLEERQEALSFEALKARCPQQISAQELLDRQQQRHISLGPSYQWIDTIYRGDREAVCHIRLPQVLEQDGAAGYELHPGLIDSCFGLLVTTGDIQVEETFIPFSIEQFRFYHQPVSRELWASVQLRENTGEEQALTGDIRLVDHSGQILAEIQGLQGRPARQADVLKSLRQTAGVDHLLYQIDWEAMPIPPTDLSASPELAHWLIFADQGKTGTRLAQMLHDQGQRPLLSMQENLWPGGQWRVPYSSGQPI